MKNKRLFEFSALLFFIVLFGFTGCTGSSFGTEKMFNGTQLFYTENITENQADILGAYLITAGFADGDEKTVQLNKSGNTFEFRMVVKKGIEQDPEYRELGKLFGFELSENVFNGANVDVHYCDENLETLAVFPMSVQQGNYAELQGIWFGTEDGEDDFGYLFHFLGNEIAMYEAETEISDVKFEYNNNILTLKSDEDFIEAQLILSGDQFVIVFDGESIIFDRLTEPKSQSALEGIWIGFEDVDDGFMFKFSGDNANMFFLELIGEGNFEYSNNKIRITGVDPEFEELGEMPLLISGNQLVWVFDGEGIILNRLDR